MAVITVVLMLGSAPASALASGTGSAAGLGFLPKPVYGRTTWHITEDWQVDWFVAAIGYPNSTVLLADDLNLDLTGRGTLHIARGVHIIGGRTPTNPGPRLFTTATRTDGPQPLFSIGEYHDADGARIVGVRIDGGDMFIAGNGVTQDDDPVTPVGISINSSINVEIANSEIFGWSGMAIQVRDTRDRINLDNASTVWIHDNYIHHNRRYRHLGYGIATSTPSSYALIERNLFDNNRHALESSGEPGVGYRAYFNHVGPNGGENSLVTYTHQFDVHGTQSCGGMTAYCGPAGQYFDYRYNTLLYTSGDVLKIRGRPELGAHVAWNVFKKDEGDGAISQTQGNNLVSWGNRFGVSGERIFAPYVCDFNGDGWTDIFMASGATWWYTDRLTGRMHYLNTSTRLLGDLTFQQVGSRCDVRVNVDGTVFRGGRGKPVDPSGVEIAAKRTDPAWIWPGIGGEAKLWRLWPALDAHTDTLVRLVRQGALAADAQLLGSGDFNADGAADMLWRDSSNRAWISLRDQLGNGIVPGRNGTQSSTSPDEGTLAGTVPAGTSFAGLGDFNADGRSDILWRRPDGQLLLWFAGESGNSTLVNYNNDLTVNGDLTSTPKEAPVPAEWKVTGIGDFNADGYSDILWRHDNGQVSIWYMVHAMHVGEANPGGPDTERAWEIQGTGDFDGDRSTDILWRHRDGGLAIWFRGLYDYGQAYPTWQNRPGWITGPEWQVKAVADFSADGRADILWQHTNGNVSIWKMSGGSYIGESAILPMGQTWQLKGLLAQAHQQLQLQ